MKDGKAMTRGMILWLVIMVAETVHGVLRGAVLSPYLGESQSARIGWPVGVLLVLIISVTGLRWTGLSGNWTLLRLGAVWAAATVAFELLIGLLRGLDGTALLAAINPLTGSIAYSAIVMLMAPLLAWRMSRRR